MKKIYSILLVLIALLSIASVAKAQEPPYIVVTEGPGAGIAYSKKISPPSNGRYTITLESFVTGSLTIQNKSVPADIVLVLDKSGSMGQNYATGIYTLVYASTNTSLGYQPSNAAFNNPTEDNKRYYKFNDGYEQVKRAQEGSDYYLFFEVGSTTYYLDGLDVTTTKPTGKYQSNSSNIWMGPLYQYNSGNVSKMTALKSAVYAFIEEIDKNDRIDPTTNQPRAERLGNKLSIITFDGNNSGQGNASSTGSSTLVADLTTFGNNKSVSDFTGKNSLRNNVRQLGTGGGTYVEHGTERAKGIITGSSSTAEVKTVVLFTDGIPGYYGDWDNNDATTSANRAIDDANTMKAAGVTMWSIGVFQNMTGTDKTLTDRYMSRVSSNFGSDAPHMNNTTATATSDKYYKSVSQGDDLNQIFKSIAEESGGSSIELDGETTSTVDIVSKSFKLPNGGNVDDIKIYTWDCYDLGEDIEYEDEDGNIQTGDFLLFKNKTLSTLKPTLSKTDPTSEQYDSISVKGFDYSSNWCGFDQKQNKYRGQKLSIEIPVMMNDDAVGGPDIETNAPGSGIYINGSDEPLIEFKSPVVSLPINIHIRKEGLNVGESSKFTIQRKLKTDPDNAWADVTSVFVTRHSGQDIEGVNAPLTKVVGLPSVTKVSGKTAEYVYRILENDWSWSYTLNKIYGYNIVYDDAGQSSLEEVDMTKTGAVSTSLNRNPFIFKNTKTTLEPKVRHAESKVSNVFEDEKTAEFDDSKSNNRTVITVTTGSN